MILTIPLYFTELHGVGGGGGWLLIFLLTVFFPLPSGLEGYRNLLGYTSCLGLHPDSFRKQNTNREDAI